MWYRLKDLQLPNKIFLDVISYHGNRKEPLDAPVLCQQQVGDD